MRSRDHLVWAFAPAAVCRSGDGAAGRRTKRERVPLRRLLDHAPQLERRRLEARRRAAEVVVVRARRADAEGLLAVRGPRKVRRLGREGRVAHGRAGGEARELAQLDLEIRGDREEDSSWRYEEIERRSDDIECRSNEVECRSNEIECRCKPPRAVRTARGRPRRRARRARRRGLRGRGRPGEIGRGWTRGGESSVAGPTRAPSPVTCTKPCAV